MNEANSPYFLIGLIVVVSLLSVVISPRLKKVDGFFSGADSQGRAPGLWTLTLSQVTTWIFARSLLNAAILGYYYGIAGTLAYTAYYLSFITGGAIVDRIRFGHKAGSIHEFLRRHFGLIGTGCYNLVIALRLLTEVFANLLVVGIILKAALPGFAQGEMIAMIGLAAVALLYSMNGGLRASLITDVMQMVLFVLALGLVLFFLFTLDGFSLGAALSAEGTAGSDPGWVLLLVAGLQVFSYPMHDPVMTDRGFLADRKTTRNSFGLAFIISSVCIFGFGLLGVQAGIIATDGQTMQQAWSAMFSPLVLFALNASLIISALSTLDSALSSSSKLILVDMRLAPATLRNGRLTMALFMVGGLLLSLGGFKDLYSAVAVSGTASMFLAPVVFFSVFGGLYGISVLAYFTAFAASMSGAVLYFFVAGKAAWALEIFGGIHEYEALLYICLAVLAVGMAAFALGAIFRRPMLSAAS